MPSPRLKFPIIGALLVLLLLALGACSSVRLTYANAPQLVWWWLDDYADFNREQAVLVRRDIDRYFDWHRATQLSEYAALLAAAQTQVGAATTAAQTCRWQDEVRAMLEPALLQGLEYAAELLPTLGEAQFTSIERRYAKGNDEMRRDFMQDDPALRQRESYKRALERAERLYGRLGDAQRRVVRDGVAGSPFNPELWLAERQRRQHETLATLRRYAAETASVEVRAAALRRLVQHAEKSPDPVYRDYQLRLGDYNCTFAAQVHNATTPAQREQARRNLKGWEDDLRALALPG